MIKQGEIYLANLNPVQGHEQAGCRPVLIMQNDILNKNLNTVLIAPLTSNLKAKGKLTTFFLDQKQSGLSQDSVVLLFQLRTIDMSRLQQKLSKLLPEDFLAMKEQLRFVF
jgi:mRNA interferase MazF